MYSICHCETDEFFYVCLEVVPKSCFIRYVLVVVVDILFYFIPDSDFYNVVCWFCIELHHCISTVCLF
jgi:hypothetical protein